MVKTKLKSVPYRIDEDVIKEIKRIGYMGETMSDVIRRILKMHKRGSSKIEAPSKIEEKLNSGRQTR